MRVLHPAVLLLLSVAACAARPPAPAAPEEAPPQAPLARAAWTEWQAWGRITIDGWAFSRPADTAATPERFARLTGYWQELPGGWQVASRHEMLRAAMRALLAPVPAEGAPPQGPQAAPGWEDIGLYAYPAWSAAFVSAVARRAGVPDYDLPSSSRHARYIDAVLARWHADPAGAAFAPRAPEDYAPREGDLLCADRSAAPLAHWSMRLASTGRPWAMHCDVVVRVAPGVVEVIGGNVQDLVTRRRLPADDAGRVMPAPPGFPVFLLVLAAQPDRAQAPIPPAQALAAKWLGE